MGGDSRLTVSVIDNVGELERLAAEWEQLLAQSAGQHFALTPTWVLTWWKVFGSEAGRRLHVLVVRNGQSLVGLFPLLRRLRWHRGVVPLRRLELLATGEDERDEVLSEYLGPIVAINWEDRVVAALAAELANDLRQWHEIVLSAVDGQSPAAAKLSEAFGTLGFTCEHRSTAACPFIRLPKDWNDYLAALPSEHRYQVRRTEREFERWAGNSHSVQVAKTRDELDRGNENPPAPSP